MKRVPSPKGGPVRAVYERIRYEEGAWPLWRWDQNLRYLTKSVLHRPTPWTDADREHWQAMRDYLASGRWRRRGGRSLRVVMGGDLMWIRAGWRTAMSPGVCEILARNDVAFVNLETPIAPSQRVPTWVYETLHYNAPVEYLDAWVKLPACVMSLCNNHALDQGRDGLAETRAVLDAVGITAVGGMRDDDTIAAVTVGGVAVGATGFTYAINRMTGEGPRGVPIVKMGGAGEPDWEALRGLLRRVREGGAEVVVVMAHWSFEYEYWPDARARAHALRLLSLGADVIVGSSPHVLQPVEVVSINGADPACPSQVEREGAAGFGLVVWSLGNLSSIMPTLACQVGALLEVELSVEGGSVSIGDLSATLTVCGRGLGDHPLAARTLTLAEYARHHDATAAQHHGAMMFAPLVGEL